jgi:hypothetical protein
MVGKRQRIILSRRIACIISISDSAIRRRTIDDIDGSTFFAVLACFLSHCCFPLSLPFLFLPYYFSIFFGINL